ncbi:IS5 family transposase [Neisseriaceae bacterium JH1-16]|nr:IS5 family transposase [Neisseriaceae bacterium JH1-16]
MTDALGQPLKLILTGGEQADLTQAQPLLSGVEAAMSLADKGYDADALLVYRQQRGMSAVILPRKNRTIQRPCDWHLYKERHLIGCFFGKLKHYRRLASRFEKTARNFMSMVSFGAVFIWLRQNFNRT